VSGRARKKRKPIIVVITTIERAKAKQEMMYDINLFFAIDLSIKKKKKKLIADNLNSS
jgi:hypothetical protein